MSAFAAMKGPPEPLRRTAKNECSRKLIIHGTADPTVHASNGDRAFARMRARSPDARIVLSEVSSGRSAVRQTLVDFSGTVLAEYIPIDGAGPAWSGGATAGTFTDPHGPDASREIIEFFLHR